MKKALFVVVVLFALIFTGCMSIHPVATSVSLENQNYEVLGEVNQVLKTHRVLGCIQWGNAGYEDFLAATQRDYPEADAIINITTDVEILSVSIYESNSYTFKGTAIKYTD